MAEFVTLTCPSCGGKLQITNDIEQFVCGYCGSEHIVRRGGGIIALAPVIEGIKKVQIGTDKTASELAIKRLEKEIHDLRSELIKAKLSMRTSPYDANAVIFIERWRSSIRNFLKGEVVADYLWEKGKISRKIISVDIPYFVVHSDELWDLLSGADCEEIEYRVREALDKSKGLKRRAYEELIGSCQRVKQLTQTILDKSRELKIHEQIVKA
ncbi:MAG: hypothetical protein Q8L41_05360 [Anaerolineales bacterium]|nr:hypothetical protein [Anaerolineales bacterium]